MCDPFAQLLRQKQKTTLTFKPIPRSEYEAFVTEMTLHSAAGKRFGEAFCEKFVVFDYALSILSDEAAKKHIEYHLYVERPKI